MQRGLIFNIQRFSLHDGPGIRTTVFLKGCALSCSWCHNPESQEARPEVMVLEDRCIRCGSCVEACPSGVPAPGEGRAAEEISLCTVCGACVDACPTEARQLAGHEVDAEALVDEIARDRIFFDQSGGGVTFSGGEPLHQAAFVGEVLTACRAAGLHSALDTCGLAPRDELLRVADLADLVLYDLKLADDLRHREHTGVGNEAIVDNLRALADTHPAVWLRVPLIPGINDDSENLDRLADLAASLPAVERICLLPYHRTGESKLARLGRQNGFPRSKPPSSEQVLRAAAPFEARGLTLQIGG